MEDTAAPAPFDEGALATEYARVVSEEQTSEATPAGSPPAEAQGSTPEATPTEQTPPDSSPAGSTPEGQKPAADEDASFLYALKLAGITDPAKADPKVIGKALVELNNRVATQEKELKALRAGSTPPPAPEATTPPAAAPVAPPAAAHVDVPPPAPDVDLETRVSEAVSRDSTHMGLAAELNRLHAEATVLVGTDAQGNFVGELPALDAEIAAIKGLLEPAEALKRAGIPTPEIDEFEKVRWETRLAKLEIDRAIRVNRLQELQFRGRNVGTQMETRREQYRQHYQQQIDQTRRDEERETGIETKAQGYLETWNSTFSAVATALKVEDGEREEFLRIVSREAKATGITALDDMKGFIERTIKAEQERLDRKYRDRQARNGSLKRADTTQSAPPGSSAVAPPLPTANTDWEASLHAAAADEYRSIGRA